MMITRSQTAKAKTKCAGDAVGNVAIRSIKQSPTQQNCRKRENEEKKEEKVKRECTEISDDTEIAREVFSAAGRSRKLVGAHISAAGGVSKAPRNARSIGCRSFALFLRNQRQWNPTNVSESQFDQFIHETKKYGYSSNTIVPHGSYLLNLGSPDTEKLVKSRKFLVEDILICERLGITLYNVHPGSTTNQCSVEDCLRNVADTINFVHTQTKGVTILLETMAGQGHTVGGTFEQLRQIMDQVKDRSRLGVCLDTCHIFAAGYDIRTADAYEKVMLDFDRIVGFKSLKAVHINDSKGDLNSHLDRHENIGKGKIGRGGFELLMRDERFDDIPLILETPEGDYASEMHLLYSLAR